MKERLRQILHYIADNGSASTVELTTLFGVSEMTIRRDLIALEKEGKIVRYYGGASIRKDQNLEASFEIRMDTNYKYKQSIGTAAVNYLKSCIKNSRPNSIFIGSGSTMHCMVKQITETIPVPVITDNIYVSSVLSKNPQNSVIIIGGQIMLPSLNVIGYTAEKMISEFTTDHAFFSTSAIDDAGNFYTYNLLEAGLFSAVVASSKHVVLLADHTKLNTHNLIQVETLSKQYTLITDDKADEKCLRNYEKLGVEILLSPSMES